MQGLAILEKIVNAKRCAARQINNYEVAEFHLTFRKLQSLCQLSCKIFEIARSISET
jgi:hypothetical protein